MHNSKKLGSPFSRIDCRNSPRALEISALYPTSNGNKSPYRADRFVYKKSPSRHNSCNENMMFNIDDECNLLGCPSTPGTPKQTKYPPRNVNKKMLDAPNLEKELPSKLIDMHDQEGLAIAIDKSVYIVKDNSNQILLEGVTPINGVCWVGDNLAISGDGHIELFDVVLEQPIRSFNDHTNRAVAMSSSGYNRFATGGGDGNIYIYDLRDNNEHSMKIKAHHDEVCSLCWSPDGNFIASGGLDNNVCVLNGKKRTVIKHDEPVHSLAWLNSGILITGERGYNGSMYSHHIRSGESKSIETGSPITGICYTEQWGLLVSHEDQASTWEVWSPDLSRKIAEFKNNHTQEILGMTANTDGSLAATISADETLVIYKLEQQVLAPAQQSPRFSQNTYSHKSPSYRNYTNQKSPSHGFSYGSSLR